MKKLFIAVLAVAGLASCTNSEIEYEPVQQQIGISPITQNLTRAMVSGTAFPESENFMVWAWYKQLAAGTNIADWRAATGVVQQLYIDEKPFVPTTVSNGLWAGQIPYFWPKLGSLLFAGYYPATEDLAEKVAYVFNDTTNIMTISNYTPTTDNYASSGFVATTTTTNHAEDLMYFKMTSASSNSAIGSVNITSEPNVDVVFQHALAWIKVTLAKAENTPEKATITVSSVKFTGVKTTGTGTVDNSADIVWNVTDATANVEVLSNAAELGTVVTVDKQPIVIPQEMAGNLVITYTISSTDNSKFEEVKTIALNTLKDNAATPNTIDKWEAGKCYTYAIVIGTSEILIAPTVTDWGEVTVPVEVK